MSLWIVDIAALDAVDEAKTLRFSSAEYTDVAYNYYEPRLSQPALFAAQAFTGELLPLAGESAIGNIEIINTDGALNYLADYAIDGRSMTLSRVTNGVASVVLTAVAERLTFNDTRVIITLRNPLAALDQTVSFNRYAGSNVLPAGVEGTADDIGGTIKPWLMGSIVNATPVLVNTSKLIYQIHDGADVTVTAVRDRGVALTLAGTASDLGDLLTTAPGAGQYRRYEGYIALGAAAQAVTCDATRDNADAGDVASEIAIMAGFTIPAADIAVLNSYGQVGFFSNSETTYAELLDLITIGCGCYYGFNSDNKLAVKPLLAPAAADLAVEEYQIKTLARLATGSGRNGLPVPAVTIRADAIATVQTDLAPTALNPARYASEYRDTTAADAAVRTRHPLAKDLVIDSPLRDIASAATVASNLLALLKIRRDTVECGVELDDTDLAGLDFGLNVDLNTARLCYPRSFVLLGWRHDAKRGRVTLVLWG